MTDFFLCCFRSCLRSKDANNTEYYEMLGLQPSASVDDIKRAYKRKSLEIHPDKIAQRGGTVTQEDLVRFQKMKDAYDVLSDPNKRRYYDEFGEGGVKIVDNTQKMNFVDLLRNFQDNKVDCVLITLLIVTVFVFVLALPILIALKADGTISTPWALIWIPMWIVDFVLLSYASLNLCCCVFDSASPEDVANAPLSTKAFYFVQILLFVIAQVTIVMKADGILTDSWLMVFAPYFVLETLVISGSLPKAVAEVPKPDYRDIAALIEDPFEQQFARIQIDDEYYKDSLMKYMAVRQVFASCVFICFAVLLGLQLDGGESMSWFLVFLPIWLYLVGQLFYGSFLAALGTKMLKKMGNQTPDTTDPVTQAEQARAASLIVMGNGELCNLLLPISMLVLLTLYLTVGGFSAFIVMIPIFALVGCFMCCTFCGLYYLSNLDVEDMEAKMEGRPGGRGRTAQRSQTPSSSSSSASSAAAAAATSSSSRAAAASSDETEGLLGKNRPTSYGMTQQQLESKPPSEMTMKELRAAIQLSGLSAQAVGLSEKQEFISLLENYRSRTKPSSGSSRGASAASSSGFTGDSID